MAKENEPGETRAANDEAERLWAEMDALEAEAAPAPAAGDPPAVEEEGPEWPADPAAPAVEEPAAEAEPPAPVEHPLGEGASEAQKAAYDKLQTELAEARETARRNAGRARKLEELRKAAQPRPTATAALDRLATARAELKERNSEYPELVDPIDKALESVQESVKDLNSIEEERRTSAQADVQTVLDEEVARFTKAHPDAVDVLQKLQGDDFTIWLLDQPAHIRLAFYNNQEAIVDAEAAIKLVDAVKAHLGIAARASEHEPADPAPSPQQNHALSDKRARQLRASAAPTNARRQPAVSGIPKTAATDQEMWEFWEAKDAEEAARSRRA